MSDARSRANQSLYLGNILLRAWRQNLLEEDIPASTLQLAFHPAVVQHLQAAYGWFLLEVADVESSPGAGPPRCVDELPALPEGRAQCAELRELQGHERAGFLAPLEQSRSEVAPRRNNANALPIVGNAGPDIAGVEAWARDFAGICERMRNSLDEC
jgi:hypothetical protein